MVKKFETWAVKRISWMSRWMSGVAKLYRRRNETIRGITKMNS